MESMMLVAVGGALGAVGRYLVGELVRTTTFPVGTLLVNTLGSFVLGVVLFGAFAPEIVIFVGIGFCGAFTTFSTFSVQTVMLFEDGDTVLAGVFGFGTAILGLFGFAFGGLVVV